MLDIIDGYKINGNFFFQKGEDLAKVSKKVPNEPGVFGIFRLMKGRVELVYIGYGEAKNASKGMDIATLDYAINNKINGINSQKFLDKKLTEEPIDALDIYYMVTYDEDHHELPAFVAARIINDHFEMHGQIPVWNKKF